MRRIFAVVALAAALTACSSSIEGQPTTAPLTSTSQKPITAAWKRNIAESIATLGAALGAVGDAMTSSDYPAMHASCPKVSTATDRIERQLPTPDIAVDDALQDGIDNYRSFAQLCMTITPDSSRTELDQLSSYLDRADERIRDAVELMGIEMPRR